MGLSINSGPEAMQRGRCARLLREPLLHFFILGTLLFVMSEHWQGRHDPDRIVVDHAAVAQISQAYAGQFGAPPSADVLRRLIARHVEEEMLYREGVKLGVERDDEVVRRRIIHKMRFLTEDMTPIPEPDDAILRTFHAGHQGRYRRPTWNSFTHIFFSTDKGDAAARARAVAALTSLSPAVTRAPERGDAFSDLYDYADLDRPNLERLMGRTQIVEGVMKAPLERWAGPYRSAYGWHLVRVSGRSISAPYTFEDVRDQVRADYLEEQRAAENRKTLDQMRQRYAVTVEGRKAE